MRLTHFLCPALVIGNLSSIGCERGNSSKGNFMIFKTAEEAQAHIQRTKITGDRFELAISGDFTFAGRPDTEGFGMAWVLDAIHAQDYMVDGFEPRGGYRLYRYKPEKAM